MVSGYTFLIILLLLIISVFVVWQARGLLIRYWKDRHKRRKWRKFAQEHHLKFISAQLWRPNIKVKGIYRGYEIELFTIWHQRNPIDGIEASHICTNVVLALSNEKSPISR